MDNETWYSQTIEPEFVLDDTLALGPRHDSLYIVIPISIIYASIFISGIIGNISTCIVIARNKSMHTATNYYLFSLAISDLLLLVCGLPVEIYQVWSKYPYIFGEVFCILRGIAAETSTNASVLTITAFTVERYVAICHPFLSQTMSKLSRAIKLILVIWFIALVCAIPQALQFGLVPLRSEYVMCNFKKVIIPHSFELSTLVFFIVPMTLIMALYALIGLKLHKSNMMKRDHRTSVNSKLKVGMIHNNKNCRHSTGRYSRRVLKMLVAVVVAFFLCWAPFHVQRLVAIYGKPPGEWTTNSQSWIEVFSLAFTYVSGVLYYVSTTINPILYNIMSHKFREAFLETLSRSCRMPRFRGRREPRSYSSISRSHRNVGNGGSRTAGTSGGSAMAQESTDCSGNSCVRDELPVSQQLTAQNCRNTITTNASNDLNCHQLNHVPYITPLTDSKQKLSSPRISNSVSRLSQESDVSSTGEHNFKVQDPSFIPLRRSTQSPRKKSRPTKKWWRLLNWLPGFKTLRPSAERFAYPQEEISSEMDRRQNEYSIALRNLKFKEDPHRLV